ncbi:hypothetical protein [Streptomyces sp. NPDC048527]
MYRDVATSPWRSTLSHQHEHIPVAEILVLAVVADIDIRDGQPQTDGEG